jgi:hypothetical protein
MNKFEKKENSTELVAERVRTWKELLGDIDPENKYKEGLARVIEEVSGDINVFIDKKIFWEHAYKVARLSMLQSPEDEQIAILSSQILEEMLNTFQDVSGESPALK